jgi:hypothetical protein
MSSPEIADILKAGTSFWLISNQHGTHLNDDKFGMLYGNHILLLANPDRWEYDN